MRTKFSLLFTLIILVVCIPHAHSRASRFLHTAVAATSPSAAHNDVVARAKFGNYTAAVPHLPNNNSDDYHNGGSSSKRDQKQRSGGGGVFHGNSSNAYGAGGYSSAAAATAGGFFNGNSSNAYGGEASAPPIPEEYDGYPGGGGQP
ncbi:hypothetical protein C2S51_036389 [Perilla frutescens var. frutescens]|nr:hypothetical protein C2S51_036389 [Perilla frutescens var. frutescens]